MSQMLPVAEGLRRAVSRASRLCGSAHRLDADAGLPANATLRLLVSGRAPFLHQIALTRLVGRSAIVADTPRDPSTA